MKTSEELIAIKMCIKTLSVKVKRIENVNKKLKKLVLEKKLREEASQNGKGNPEFINDFSIERRALNLIARG